MHAVLNMIHSTPAEQTTSKTDNDSAASTNHSDIQNEHIRREISPETPSSTSLSSSHPETHGPPTDRYKPLPSILIDFIAITLCDIIPFRQPRRRRSQPLQSPSMQNGGRSMPELVYFIQKITCQARINCRTALVALIYLDRAKAALPKNIVASYDTCHRMLLGALLLASKYLQDSDWAPNYSPRMTQSSTFDPTLPWSCYYGHTTRQHVRPLTNRRLCDMCAGLYTLEDINQLERAFLKLIQYRCWLDDKDINDFVLQHRTDFAL